MAHNKLGIGMPDMNDKNPRKIIVQNTSQLLSSPTLDKKSNRSISIDSILTQ